MKPILFSTPMVQALLNGSKTQTRRIVKPQPVIKNCCYTWWKNGLKTTNGTLLHHGSNIPFTECPYGKIGDVLWVRETFTKNLQDNQFDYKADYPSETHYYGWKPSIHMPRYACRIFLKIVKIRIEQLQDINEYDAMDEGIKVIHLAENVIPVYKNYLLQEEKGTTNPIKSFLTLWESINGKESIKLNPFVWVLDFELCEKPSDFI